MERKRCIVLVRESTTAQDIASQKEEAYNMAIKDGYSPDDIIIIGKAGSSAIKKNEQYVADMEEVLRLLNNDPTIKDMYVWAIDRIGRTAQYLYAIRDTVLEKKIQLTIHKPWCQLLTPTGERNDTGYMAYGMFATMAEMEMEHKKARFARAKKHNAIIGRANGGAKNIPFGYAKDANGFFVIDREEAEIVKLIFELHNSGKYSLNKLALELNERGYTHRGKKFTNFFLRMFIKSTVVIGYSDIEKKKTGWKVRRIYPQIISKEQWEKAQQVLRDNQVSTYKGTKHYYFGAKLLWCECCNHHYATDGNQYRCKVNSRKTPRLQQGLSICENNTTILTSVLDGILWNLAETKHLNFLLKEKDISAERNRKQIEINLQKIAAAKVVVAGQESRIERINERWEAGRISDKQADSMIDKVNAECNKAKNDIAALENDNTSLQRQLDSLAEISYKSVMHLTAQVAKMQGDEKQMYDLVHQYIKRATIKRTTIDGKGCTVITVHYYDGTDDIIYYFSKNRKCAIYKRGKIDRRLRYAFTDSEGNSYIPYDAPKIERDKDGKVIEPEVSSIEIKDKDANKVMTEEIARQNGRNIRVNDDGSVTDFDKGITYNIE